MSFKSEYEKGRQVLERAGVREADTDARILLEYVAQIDRSYYYLHMHEEMDAPDAEEYETLIRRRAEREPLQYVTSEAPFYGEMFYVTPDVLIPRQDTEVLVEEVLRYVNSGSTVLDMCTGSGCILLTIIRLSHACGTGVDLSPGALAVFERNRKRMGLEAACIQSNLFERVEGKYDLITANPPYIASGELSVLDPEVRLFEPQMALDGGRDGLEILRPLIRHAGEYLKPGGRLFTEIGCDQGEETAALFRENGYTGVAVIKDLEGRDRVVTGCGSV
ncbi:MAG: peptide chain release factor N(5)-glutamine methyltransferase [Eubacterium sp.]|nr:peptide chain release factor N(5)-glutamine methyltransferase [Eubacterium sp.]